MYLLEYSQQLKEVPKRNNNLKKKNDTSIKTDADFPRSRMNFAITGVQSNDALWGGSEKDCII